MKLLVLNKSFTSIGARLRMSDLVIDHTSSELRLAVKLTALQPWIDSGLEFSIDWSDTWPFSIRRCGDNSVVWARRAKG